MKKIILIIAGAASLGGCAGPVTRNDFSQEQLTQMTRAAGEMQTNPIQAETAKLLVDIPPATDTGTVTATATNTIFSDETQREYFKIVDRAASELEGFEDALSRAQIAYAGLSTTQSRALLSATPTLALSLAEEAAKRTYALQSRLTADTLFASRIDEHINSLEKIASSTQTTESKEAAARIAKFRNMSEDLTPILNGIIAAKYLGADFGEDMSGLLQLYETTQLLRGSSTALHAQNTLRYANINEAGLVESFEGASYAYEIQDTAHNARLAVTAAYYKEDSTLTRDYWIAAMHYITSLENSAAIKQGLDKKDDAQRAVESMPWATSLIPIVGPILASRGPWTGKMYHDVPNENLHEIAAGVYTGITDPTFPGAEALQDRRLGGIISHIVYAAMAGGARELTMKGGGSKSFPTGSGEIIPGGPGTTGGIIPGGSGTTGGSQ